MPSEHRGEQTAGLLGGQTNLQASFSMVQRRAQEFDGDCCPRDAMPAGSAHAVTALSQGENSSARRVEQAQQADAYNVALFGAARRTLRGPKLRTRQKLQLCRPSRTGCALRLLARRFAALAAHSRWLWHISCRPASIQAALGRTLPIRLLKKLQQSITQGWCSTLPQR